MSIVRSDAMTLLRLAFSKMLWIYVCSITRDKDERVEIHSHTLHTIDHMCANRYSIPNKVWTRRDAKRVLTYIENIMPEKKRHLLDQAIAKIDSEDVTFERKSDLHESRENKSVDKSYELRDHTKVAYGITAESIRKEIGTCSK